MSIEKLIDNLNELFKFLEKFKFYGLKTTVFEEPDIGNQITAIAVEPNVLSYKLTKKLPLALKECQI